MHTNSFKAHPRLARGDSSKTCGSINYNRKNTREGYTRRPVQLNAIGKYHREGRRIWPWRRPFASLIKRMGLVRAVALLYHLCAVIPAPPQRDDQRGASAQPLPAGDAHSFCDAYTVCPAETRPSAVAKPRRDDAVITACSAPACCFDAVDSTALIVVLDVFVLARAAKVRPRSHPSTRLHESAPAVMASMLLALCASVESAHPTACPPRGPRVPPARTGRGADETTRAVAAARGVGASLLRHRTLPRHRRLLLVGLRVAAGVLRVAARAEPAHASWGRRLPRRDFLRL